MKKIVSILAIVALCLSVNSFPAQADSNPSAGLVMYPSEDSFAPLDSTLAVEPLPYATNSKDSFISFLATSPGGTWSFATLTPDICSGFSVWHPTEAAKSTFTKVSFSTGLTGLCKLDVTYSVAQHSKETIFKFPVADWPVALPRVEPSIALQNIFGDVQPGYKTDPISIRFSYRGSINMTDIVPISVKDATPAVCNMMPDGTVLALGVGLGSGVCGLTYSWPNFSFSNHKFSAGSASVKVLTVSLEKTPAQLDQEKAAARSIASAKKKALALLISRCPKYKTLLSMKADSDNAAANSISIAQTLQAMNAKEMSMGSIATKDPNWIKTKANLGAKFAGSIGTWKAYYNAATSAIRKAGSKCVSAVGMPSDSLLYYANQYNLP